MWNYALGFKTFNQLETGKYFKGISNDGKS